MFPNQHNIQNNTHNNKKKIVTNRNNIKGT